MDWSLSEQIYLTSLVLLVHGWALKASKGGGEKEGTEGGGGWDLTSWCDGTWKNSKKGDGAKLS